MPIPVNEAKRVKTKELYQNGKGSRVIASILHENPTTTYRRLVRMGLNRSKEEAQSIKLVEPTAIPFSNILTQDTLRKSATGEAIRWFLSRGYTPSIPVEPVRYDLVVESDIGLLRVQVKSTTRKLGSFWCVQTCRLEYDKSLRSNSSGKRKKTSYSKDDVDLFFVLTQDGSRYLVGLLMLP